MSTVRTILGKSTTQTVVALALTGAFTIGFLRGDVGADLFVAQFSVVVGFLFGQVSRGS